jgi:hypothetical protein
MKKKSSNFSLFLALFIAAIYFYGFFLLIFDFESMRKFSQLVFLIQIVSTVSALIISNLIKDFSLQVPKSSWDLDGKETIHWWDHWINEELKSSYTQDIFKQHMITWKKRQAMFSGIFVLALPYTFIYFIAS